MSTAATYARTINCLFCVLDEQLKDDQRQPEIPSGSLSAVCEKHRNTIADIEYGLSKLPPHKQYGAEICIYEYEVIDGIPGEPKQVSRSFNARMNADQAQWVRLAMAYAFKRICHEKIATLGTKQ